MYQRWPQDCLGLCFGLICSTSQCMFTGENRGGLRPEGESPWSSRRGTCHPLALPAARCHDASALAWGIFWSPVYGFVHPPEFFHIKVSQLDQDMRRLDRTVWLGSSVCPPSSSSSSCRCRCSPQGPPQSSFHRVLLWTFPQAMTGAMRHDGSGATKAASWRRSAIDHRIITRFIIKDTNARLSSRSCVYVKPSLTICLFGGIENEMTHNYGSWF